MKHVKVVVLSLFPHFNYFLMLLLLEVMFRRLMALLILNRSNCLQILDTCICLLDMIIQI